jgi:hypothetical protein
MIHIFHLNVLQLNFHLYLKKVLENIVQCSGINIGLVVIVALKWFSLVCIHTSYQRLVNFKDVRPMTLQIC